PHRDRHALARRGRDVAEPRAAHPAELGDVDREHARGGAGHGLRGKPLRLSLSQRRRRRHVAQALARVRRGVVDRVGAPVVRGGLRAFDADTHVNPAADVLDRHVDPSFRPRLAELDPYRVAAGQMIGGTPDTSQYRVATKFYRRVLGDARPHETFTGRARQWRGRKNPGVGVQGDQAENRIKDMAEEGSDAQFLVPTLWPSVVVLPDVTIEVELIRAYHRHAAAFCGQFPERLKTAIVASTRAVDEAVREIRHWGRSTWAVAVMPLLGDDRPVDHPDLE